MRPLHGFVLVRLVVAICLPWSDAGHPTNAVSSLARPSDEASEDGFALHRFYTETNEEIPVGSALLDLSAAISATTYVQPASLASTDDTALTDPSNHLHLDYRISEGLDAALFRVDTQTGQLVTAARLDREALCASQRAQFCCKPNSRIPGNLIQLRPLSGGSEGRFEGTLSSSSSSSPYAHPVSSSASPTGPSRPPVPAGQVCHLAVQISATPRPVDPETAATTAEGQNPGITSAQLGQPVSNHALRPQPPINQPGDQLSLIQIYVRLHDINDHAPLFLSRQILQHIGPGAGGSITVPEDSQSSGVLHHFVIHDADVGQNGLQEVRLEVVPLVAPSAGSSNASRVPGGLISSVESSTESGRPGAESWPLLPNELLEPFSLRRTRDGASLVLKGRLDREVVSAYDLNLVALDGGRPVARSSHLSLRILISDANDNAPVWLAPVPSHLSAGDDDDRPASRRGADTTEAVLPRYEVTLAEDIKVGSLVAWPQASDADAGDNARLAYAIDTSAPGGQAALDQFSVQSSTGEVRLRLPLNYEALAAAASQSTDSRDSMTRDRRGDVELELPLIVRDSPRTGRPLSSSALLVVHVVDVNDAPPSIVVSPLTSVRDHQRLVGTGLSVRPPPVYDSAMPGLTTRLFEGGPRRESRSVFGVWENRAPGQPVASVFVTDPDTGPGGLVSCSLQRTDAFRLQAESARRFGGKETVDEDSAEDPEAVPIAPGSRTYQLVSTQRLDREERSVFQLVITCRDHDPRQPLMASQRVHIAVLDENDNQPVFTRPVFQLSLPEHSAPGRLIGRVNATDADFGRNGQLRYWAAPEAESWVSVHPVTGEVHVNAILDREVEPERRFLVYAADQAEPSTAAFTATSMVVVRVLDENDHVPQFTNLYFFSVLENSPSGTLVGRVEATDEDEGKNGQIRYFLRDPSKEFQLNADTGELTVRGPSILEPVPGLAGGHSTTVQRPFSDAGRSGDRRQSSLSSTVGGSGAGSSISSRLSPLDRETRDAYEVTVIAEDSGTPPKRSSAQVHISISDENDHSPIFIYPPPPTGSVGLLRGAQPVGGAGLGASGGLGEYAIVDRVNVTCSQLGSQIIVRVLANDSDIGRNGEVVYSLARSNQETESADSTRLAAGTNWAVSADPAKNISGTLVTRTDVLAADYTFG